MICSSEFQEFLRSSLDCHERNLHTFINAMKHYAIGVERNYDHSWSEKEGIKKQNKKKNDGWGKTRNVLEYQRIKSDLEDES